ncbi:hypothetical protein ACTNDG_07100 [Clostridium sp. HCP1S3_B4]
MSYEVVIKIIALVLELLSQGVTKLEAILISSKKYGVDIKDVEKIVDKFF